MSRQSVEEVLILLQTPEHSFLSLLSRLLSVLENFHITQGPGPQRVLEGTMITDSAGSKLHKYHPKVRRNVLQRRRGVLLQRIALKIGDCPILKNANKHRVVSRVTETVSNLGKGCTDKLRGKGLKTRTKCAMLNLPRCQWIEAKFGQAEAALAEQDEGDAKEDAAAFAEEA